MALRNHCILSLNEHAKITDNTTLNRHHPWSNISHSKELIRDTKSSVIHRRPISREYTEQLAAGY